jgi:hypothetical protein
MLRPIAFILYGIVTIPHEDYYTPLAYSRQSAALLSIRAPSYATVSPPDGEARTMRFNVLWVTVPLVSPVGVPAPRYAGKE